MAVSERCVGRAVFLDSLRIHFFHVYGQRRDISGREFFGNRFSRLYPLHFVTLCVVAALQAVSFKLFGHFQIYPKNDPYHFFLNLLLASDWGFQSGLSFNSPIWSISVEVLAYVMFFAYLKSVGVSLASSLAWFIWSLIFYVNAPISIFECSTLFSLGGVIHQVGESVRQRWGAKANFAGAIVATVAAITLLIRTDLSPPANVMWTLFPTLIWLAAALDRMNVSSGRIGVTFGHLTYASYLIHVPIQIIAIMALDGLVRNRSIINSPWFLVTFVAVVLSSAWLIYQFIERPAQTFLRERLAYFKAAQTGRAPLAQVETPDSGKI